MTVDLGFDDAHVAQQAIEEFSQMRCVQDLFDNKAKVSVGLMGITTNRGSVQHVECANIFPNCDGNSKYNCMIPQTTADAC